MITNIKWSTEAIDSLNVLFDLLITQGFKTHIIKLLHCHILNHNLIDNNEIINELTLIQKYCEDIIIFYNNTSLINTSNIYEAFSFLLATHAIKVNNNYHRPGYLGLYVINSLSQLLDCQREPIELAYWLTTQLIYLKDIKQIDLNITQSLLLRLEEINLQHFSIELLSSIKCSLSSELHFRCQYKHIRLFLFLSLHLAKCNHGQSISSSWILNTFYCSNFDQLSNLLLDPFIQIIIILS